MRTHFGSSWIALRAGLGAVRARRRTRRRCASDSPRIRTCSTRRSPARSSGASCSRRSATSSFDIDEKLAIVPQLATSYEWSADNKALTLKIRPGRHVPRRREARRRRRQVQPRAAQDDGRLEPPRRARAGRERRCRRSDDRAPQPVGAVRAAARAARRPRRHDGLAEGRAGGRRQVRRQARLLGAVPLRRARRAGPHRRSSAIRTTGTRARSTSTGSSTCRSSTRRCGSPT